MQKQEILRNYIVKLEMKQKVFVKKTENFITMINSLLIHMKKYVSSDHAILLKRSYCKAKNFPLTRTIISFSSSPDGSASPYVAVFYQTIGKISRDSKILCHGNAKKRVSLEKPYTRTNDQVLSKAREFINKGRPRKQVYDQINQESGGVFESPSQVQERRDTKQVYRQKRKMKSAENEDDEFELLLRF